MNIISAIDSLRPNSGYSLKTDKYEDIEWHDKNSSLPTKEEIQTKLIELEAAEPLRLLRIERNKKLAETDWMANSDVVMVDDWKMYRQALRDLPTTAEPQLDDVGNLTNIDWPEVPE